MPPSRLLPVLLGLCLLGPACTTTDSSSPDGFAVEGRLAFVAPAGDTLQTIGIDIADTDAERRQGLMEKRTLGYDRGMLFVFETVEKHGMWMKNTPLPLDIVFVAPDSQVINIARRTTPFSETTLRPSAPNKFAVEVRAGFADRFGLSDATRIRWVRTE
jgi:uncharacterized membrane protein (UPF0127 family)